MIVHSDHFDIHSYPISRDIVALKFPTVQQDPIIINIYASPNDNFEKILDQLDIILHRNKGIKKVIKGDFNAKNCIQGGGSLDDKRGGE